MKTQTLLDKILRDFENIKRPEDAETLGRKAWGMILQYQIESLIGVNAPQFLKDKVIADTTAKALTWDTDDAGLSSVQKMFNRLASERYAEAVILAESSIMHKQATTKNTLKQNSKKGTDKKHSQNNEIIEKAMKYYVDNINLYQGYGGKKRASNYLESKFPPIKSSTYYRHLKDF